METMEDVKAKIAKLLAMANDGRGNEFEMEAALRHAEALMRKHGIDAAELQDRTGEKPVYQWSTVYVPAGAPKPVNRMPLWFNWLIAGIAKFTDCKVSIEHVQGHGSCAKFQGDDSDVQFAVWLAKHLRDDCRRQAEAYPGDRGERESFRKGYANRVYDRMQALLKERRAAFEQAKTSTGTALVVVDRKIALRDAEFGAQRFSSSGRFRTKSRNAYGSGRIAGDRANLSRPLEGAQQKQLR